MQHFPKPSIRKDIRSFNSWWASRTEARAARGCTPLRQPSPLLGKVLRVLRAVPDEHLARSRLCAEDAGGQHPARQPLAPVNVLRQGRERSAAAGWASSAAQGSPEPPLAGIAGPAPGQPAVPRGTPRAAFFRRPPSHHAGRAERRAPSWLAPKGHP